VRRSGAASPHGGADIAVEVHVTVAMEATPAKATPNVERQGEAPASPARAEMSHAAVLTQVAALVREAVYRVMRDLRLAPPSAVDVLIDDIQVSA
jgi:hypothetical protein